MKINIADVKYKVVALLTDGSSLDLSNLITGFSWGKSKGEFASKAEMEIAQTKIPKGFIHELLPLCTKLYIYADVGTGWDETFRGSVWDWRYRSALQEQKTSLVVYDKSYYLTKSKDNSYYSAGQTTQAIVEDLCKRWGVALEYGYDSITHEKVRYNSQALADQIENTIQEANKKLGKNSVIYMKKDVLHIRKKGDNETIFCFTSKENAIDTDMRMSMDTLVTKVVICGNSPDDGVAPTLKSKEGDTRYGVIQEIITKGTNTSLADAEKEAAELLRERGKPEQTIEVNLPDVPILCIGDKIKVSAGNLNTYFIVLGAMHYPDSKRMTVQLEYAR